tara:strand:+ start:727 stop:1050 length:324 start_codon:yes stop_codon:yes gene_type:complete
MEAIQILILIFALFALSRVFVNIKDKNLEKLEAIFWLLFWTTAIFITINPKLASYASEFFGVERGSDMVVYSSIIVIAYLTFRLYAKLTHAEKNITKIVRKIAIDKR